MERPREVTPGTAVLDPTLLALLERAGPLPELLPAADPFAALLRGVVGQQLSTRAAGLIAARLEAASGFGPSRLLALPGDELRALGLSWAKVRTVQAAAAAALDGRVDFARLTSLPDEEVVAELLPLPGIGRWTAEMYLIFALARPDVFAWGDLGLRRGLELYYPQADHAAVVAGWAGHRTTGAQALWAAQRAGVLPGR